MISRFKKSRKRTKFATVGVLVLALAIAATAGAYLLGIGGGSNANVSTAKGTARAVSVTVSALDNPALFPGDSGSGTLVIHNATSTSLHVGTIGITVSDATNPGNAECAFTGSTGSFSGATIPAGGDSAAIPYTVSFTDLATDQSSCEGDAIKVVASAS